MTHVQSIESNNGTKYAQQCGEFWKLGEISSVEMTGPMVLVAHHAIKYCSDWQRDLADRANSVRCMMCRFCSLVSVVVDVGVGLLPVEL